MVDPSDPAKMRQHPTPWVDGPAAIRWYMETNSVPLELLNSAREDDDMTMKRATDQAKRMLKGENVPGIPGESDAHKRVHVAQLTVLNRETDKIAKEIEQLGPLAQQYAQVIPQFRDIEEKQMMSQIFAMHLEVDNTAVSELEQQAIQENKPQQVPMPPGLTPAGSGQPPMPAGGNQTSGMGGEPQMGGPGGNSGRPPLVNQGTPQ